MQHPQLGVIETDEKSGSGTLLFHSQSIPLRIELDGESLDDALSFASLVYGIR